ncbi:MAG: VWA domain-containing protein [Chloroflexi bacterium]|nr:VWA domain-containing protein [Chloroflexota bacterium]
MAFTRPLFLLLLAVLFYFASLGRPKGRYGRGRAWTALVLRCLIVFLIVLSLAGMQSVHGGDELAVVFLLDVSDSVSETEQEQALDFVEQALIAMGPDDQAALVLFGTDALVERPMMGGGELGTVASIPRTHQTDLEGAIRAGVALFPAGSARRMVILSDGRPTLGEAEQAVRLAQAQGVQVDVVSLGAVVQNEAWLSELVAPDRLHQDEEFTLSITARATTATEAVLTVLAGERVVAQEAVHLNPGTNTFAIPLTAGEPGFTPFRAYLTPIADAYPQNNGLSAFTMVEGPPRVLLVTADPAESDLLRAALQAAGLTVAESSPGALVSDLPALAEYAAVVLVNTPAQSLSPRALSALQSYVRDLGGGLVAVGGPHAYGVGGWYNTPLEETLPVEMTIHDQERFPPMSIVVVIDKSGSMAAQESGVQKIRLAGEAAARVAELITALDEITVIAFDDRPVDIIGPLPGSQREEVIDQVVRLQAGGGGIYVRESLEVALGYLADSDRTIRHIILLADGSDSEHQEGVREMIEEEMVAQNITLSSVAIGAGQDLRFLQEIAELGGGRYHFTNQAANLPVIFAEETQLAMRSYIVEEPFFPRQTSTSPILTGIDTVPQLAGYVATTPKSASRVILSTHQDDPLLAAWQYGLGRSVAWTSDATSRWAQRWVEWEGFGRFWGQVVRWTIVERTDVPVEVNVALEGEEAHVTVDAVDEGGGFVNGLDAGVSLVGPDGEPVLVELAQIAPGRYEGTFTPQEEGAYLMRLTGSLEGEDAVALTTGWVMGYSPEYAALEGDPAYLAHLAELSGGVILEEPSDAFARTLRGEGSTRDLWPYLLGLATLLLPFDIGVRRLALGRQDWAKVRDWVLERLPRRRPRPVAETPSPVSRLFEAKARSEARRAEGELSQFGRRPTVDALTSEVPLSPSTERSPIPPSRPVERPSEQPSASSTIEGETLAERLLRRKQERREDE